jgi:hypothetical protein
LARRAWSPGCSSTPRQSRSCSSLVLSDRRGLPEEAGELAGACHRHLAGGLAAPAPQVRPAIVQTALGTPGDRADPGVLAVLAAAQLGANPRFPCVVMRGLDQKAAGMNRAGLGDAPLAAALVGGSLARGDSEKPGQLAGLREALKAPGSAAGRGSAPRRCLAGRRSAAHRRSADEPSARRRGGQSSPDRPAPSGSTPGRRL